MTIAALLAALRSLFRPRSRWSRREIDQLERLHRRSQQRRPVRAWSENE